MRAVVLAATALLAAGALWYYTGATVAPGGFPVESAGEQPAELAEEAAGLAPDSLGGAPLCEASAARLVTLDGRPMVLVGDNEVGDQLFAIPINGDRLEGAERVDLPFPNGSDVEDIEALTVGPEGAIEVYGSHSRNKRCSLQPERRAVITVRLGDGLVDDVLHQTPRVDCALLRFTTPETLCPVIERSEAAADAASELRRADRPEACEVDPAFNLEGAVRAGPATWVGLRAPLVAGMSVLLRRASGLPLSFDAATYLDLGGFGVRELLREGPWVYGIAGPPADGAADFQLFRFPVAELRPGTTIGAELLRPLPTSSEGLVIHQRRFFVLIDGAEGPSPDAPCQDDARWISFVL